MVRAGACPARVMPAGGAPKHLIAGRGWGSIVAGKAPHPADAGRETGCRPETTVMKPAIRAVLAMTMPCALLASGPAAAMNQYNTVTLSCSEVQAAVQRDGQAQLRYPSPDDPSQPLYGAFVANSSYCNARATKTVTVPARDTAQCRVRRCKPHAGR